MTEYWVSQGKHWCEMCKCWLNDTPTSRANHEKGSGHKINVQRRLREMRLKAEAEKHEEADTKEQLERIEEAAELAYQKDLDLLVRSVQLQCGGIAGGLPHSALACGTPAH